MTGGPAAAFQSLYDEHGEGVYHYLLGRVRRVEVAEDLLQTVMLRVVRNRRKLRTLENPRAWLFTVARNELRRHLAKAARRGVETGDEPIPLLPAPEAEEDEDLEALRGSLGRLAPERWEVVSLKVYQQLTFAEIGKVLGISPNTAASRYRYALDDLKRMLGRSDEPRRRPTS
jgi:RNA polymerase sigma-70 factor (ECF subfamily)